MRALVYSLASLVGIGARDRRKEVLAPRWHCNNLSNQLRTVSSGNQRIESLRIRAAEADAPLDKTGNRTSNNTDFEEDMTRQNKHASLENEYKQMYTERTGLDQPMNVYFKEFRPFDVWIWFEFYQELVPSEESMLQECLRSWFMVGRLGGYNAANLQLSTNVKDDLSYFKYDNEHCEETLDSYLHCMRDLETTGNRARIWLDLGTCDETCLDILINMLNSFSREHAGIKSLTIGGESEEWSIPKDFSMSNEISFQNDLGLDGLDDANPPLSKDTKFHTEDR